MGVEAGKTYGIPGKMIRCVLLNRRVNVRVAEKKKNRIHLDIHWRVLNARLKNLSCERPWGANEGFRRGDDLISSRR